MNGAIGVFDSGLGGLTVMKEMIEYLPNEDILYFGDTARVPYGSKSEDTIKKFSHEISEFLIKKDIKMLVVACNTASSFALSYLAERLDIPIVGVIEPGVDAAASLTQNDRIGIIGTVGTIGSNSYQNALKAKRDSIEIFTKPCPLFVPLVEEGWIDKEVSFMIAREYLKELKDKDIDTLILGCTHYPILKNVISNIMEDVQIVDSAKETAKVVKDILNKKKLILDNKDRGEYKFYVSDDPEKFQTLGKRFLNRDIFNIEKVFNIGI